MLILRKVNTLQRYHFSALQSYCWVLTETPTPGLKFKLDGPTSKSCMCEHPQDLVQIMIVHIIQKFYI